MAFFGLFSGSRQPAQIDSILDLVTYVAGLASNPTDIDPLIDQVRAITAKLAPGEGPSPLADSQLVAIYLQLETYLTAKEPIRTFTRQDLRVHISPKLLQMITRNETNINEKEAS